MILNTHTFLLCAPLIIDTITFKHHMVISIRTLIVLVLRHLRSFRDYFVMKNKKNIKTQWHLLFKRCAVGLY